MTFYYGVTVRHLEDVKMFLLPPTEILGGTRDGYVLRWHVYPKLDPCQCFELDGRMPAPFMPSLWGTDSSLVRGQNLELCYTPDDMLIASRMDPGVVDRAVDPPSYLNKEGIGQYREDMMCAFAGLSDRTKKLLMQVLPAGGKVTNYPYNLLNVPLWPHFLAEITRALSSGDIPFPCKAREDTYWVALLEAYDWWRRKLLDVPVYRDIRKDLVESGVVTDEPRQMFWGDKRHQCYEFTTESLLEAGVPTP